MRLFEYEGKEIFSRYQIPVLQSRLARSSFQAIAAVDEVGLPAVIKAQVLVGGRGNAGGIAIVRNEDEAADEAKRIMRMRIHGEPVRALLVEEAAEHTGQLYASISLDRGTREFVALVSKGGGTEVEKSGKGTMLRVSVPLEGLDVSTANSLASKLGLKGRPRSSLRSSSSSRSSQERRSAR
jgi:succinyl-CoA synthetase beta subunit